MPNQTPRPSEPKAPVYIPAERGSLSEKWTNERFRRFYSEPALQAKLLRFAKTAGRELVVRALSLYYAARDPSTPRWARTTIYGALGYFISTIDFLPDVVPMAGFTDDLAILGAALATVAAYITPSVRERAEATADRWLPKRPN